MQFNNEDMRNHRTVALVATDEGFPQYKFGPSRYLFSINLKHRMVTFPIGKCHPNEGLADGLIRETLEELGLKLNTNDITKEPCCSFTKIYDFTGTPVEIETNLFRIKGGDGDWICRRAVNREPDKCGGIFIATLDDAINIAKSTGLQIADCVTFYRQSQL